MKRESFIVPLIVVGGVIAAFVFLHNASNKKIERDELGSNFHLRKFNILKYGEKIPKSLVDNYLYPDKLLLIEFFSLLDPHSSGSLRYLNALYEKYKNKGLSVIGISDGGIGDNRAFRKENMLSFPLVADTTFELHKSFRVKESQGATFLVDRNGVVIFSTPYLAHDDLARQITEKFVLGAPQVVFTKHAIFEVGKMFPSLHIYSPEESLAVSDLYSKSLLILTFFSHSVIRCPKCKQKERIMSLNMLSNKFNRDDLKIIGVITYPVRKEEIRSFRTKYELAYPLFAVADFEEDCATREFLDVPMTLIIDKEGKILFIEGPEKPEKDVIKRIVNFYTEIANRDFSFSHYNSSIVNDKKGGTEATVQPIYQYGDVAPPFRLVDHGGRVFTSYSLSGKIILVEFFNPDDTQHTQVISYVDVLWNRYKDKGLKVLAVSKLPFLPHQKEKFNKLSIPIIIDDDLTIHKLFRVKDCCGATLLIDQKGIIRFITDYLAESNLTRQIVEKELKLGEKL